MLEAIKAKEFIEEVHQQFGQYIPKEIKRYGADAESGHMAAVMAARNNKKKFQEIGLIPFASSSNILYVRHVKGEPSGTDAST